MRSEYREEPCRSALNRVTGMPFPWSLNPYMGCAHRCAFCYVRGFERRADRPSDDRYGTSIRVKVNVAEVLRVELARPGWKRETVTIGAATDPYQPIEGRYRLTRSCIRELSAARNPFSIITRGPLVVRDIDVLREASRRADVEVHVSIPTLDDRVWRTTEPGTSHPRARLKAIAALSRAGIKTLVAMAPLLPGISDAPGAIETVVRAARDAGACGLWSNVVYLRPGTREHFFAMLEREWPEERARYEKLFAGRAYVDRTTSELTRGRVSALKRGIGIADRREEKLAPPEQAAQMEMPLPIVIAHGPGPARVAASPRSPRSGRAPGSGTPSASQSSPPAMAPTGS